MYIHGKTELLEDLTQGFKRTTSWNKYRSEITTQPKINNLDYMVDTTFRNINRLFVQSFKDDGKDPTTDSFEKYSMPLVEIEDFNALINNKPFFQQPIKKRHVAHEEHVDASRNKHYTTVNILDYLYHQKYYILIRMDLSRQTNTSIPQEIHFIIKLEEGNGGKNAFYC